MAGSTYGTVFRVMTWGESHGKGIGAVVDGCPAGLALNEADIQAYLDRRKPGQSRFTTARAESDRVEILSGVFEGKTMGTPIALELRNSDQHSADYSNIKDIYRPGHADFTFDEKYGFRDYRGGGRSSGRETAGRVAAGAIAAKLLSSLGVYIRAYTKAIGPVSVSPEGFDLDVMWENKLYMPDREAALKAQDYIDGLIKTQDSGGGIVECVIKGLPAVVGEPVFDKLDGCLAKAMLSIGAVKGFEIGAGFEAASSTGSVDNDSFCASQGAGALTVRHSRGIGKRTNHAGGTLGGISDGSEVVFRAAFKPTPSIARPQQTVDRQGKEREIIIHGRHDPLIVPRAVVVVEAMAALTVADLLLVSMSSRLDFIQKFFSADWF